MTPPLNSGANHFNVNEFALISDACGVDGDNGRAETKRGIIRL